LQVTVQQLRDAGLDVSELESDFSGAVVLDQHEVIRRTDVAPDKVAQYDQLAAVVTLKPMKEMRWSKYDYRRKMYGLHPLGLLSNGQCRPAESPLEPGLHMARIDGEQDWRNIYWFGMARSQTRPLGFRMLRSTTSRFTAVPQQRDRAAGDDEGQVRSRISGPLNVQDGQ
jgi:hypothetical protein